VRNRILDVLRFGTPIDERYQSIFGHEKQRRSVEPVTNFVILSEAKNLVISSGSAAMMIRDVSLRST
jgi:hypothetical protein